MGHKFKVTNISEAPVFIAEAGRLVQPRLHTTAGRLDESTRNDPRLRVEEGDFEIAGKPAKITNEKQRYEEEDEDEKPTLKTAVDDKTVATLVPAVRLSRVVPLEAVSSAPAAAKTTKAAATDDDGPDDDAPLAADELDAEIPKADRFVPKGEDEKAKESAGFVTRRGLPTEPLPGGDDPVGR